MRRLAYPERSRRGFTLIELLVVVAIIGILATVVVVNLTNSQKKARDAKRKADISSIEQALGLYFVDSGQYPAQFVGYGTSMCSALSSTGDAVTTRNPDLFLSQLLSEMPNDPLFVGSYDYTRYNARNYFFCQAKVGGVWDRGTYAVWANLESESGNADSAVWPISNPGYRYEAAWNWVVANFRP